jgi:hypothetical protein
MYHSWTDHHILTADDCLRAAARTITQTEANTSRFILCRIACASTFCDLYRHSGTLCSLVPIKQGHVFQKLNLVSQTSSHVYLVHVNFLLQPGISSELPSKSYCVPCCLNFRFMHG